MSFRSTASDELKCYLTPKTLAKMETDKPGHIVTTKFISHITRKAYLMADLSHLSSFDKNNDGNIEMNVLKMLFIFRN
jgi:hypothetical protein